MNTSILVIDVGTSGLRAAVVRPDATVTAMHYREFVPHSPFSGLVEFDATEMARLVLEVAHTSLAEAGPVAAVGITTQRASTILWDRSTGVPLGPALGWQDLRTVGECIMAKAEHGLALAPNQTATKAAWLLKTYVGDEQAIAARADNLCIGTVDSWIAWTLSQGTLHVTDHSNAAVTGLADVLSHDDIRWHERACSVLGVPISMLPTLVASSGIIGLATALPGSPPIASIAGDQQASLIGQSCVRRNMAKCTFGTGGMMNVCLGESKPVSAERSRNGTFPIVAWSQVVNDASHLATWGAEAIMLSAGTNVEWLRDDMGLISTAEESDEVARACQTSDGVVYVPALLGLGTPHWDYGARGALFGLTRGSTRAHIVRAVLEGVAHRGADLLEAIETDYPNVSVPEIRVDGGMSRNPTFIQALANATNRPISVAPITEATTLGAAYLAGLAVGTWSNLQEIESLWSPHATVDPQSNYDRPAVRAQWERAVTRAAGWITELSSLDF
ncbi:MAG: FGGY-family carbohydrate kinase [Ilumatobacteraceae bacterium]|jgi:glycerol kinase|nr:FGGY-family carbohydrate kinase [Ilumatobacteraceae bacterium]